MQVDVTNPDEWTRSYRALAGIAGIHRHVVLVDLLLNRTTVTTMRTSLTAASSYVLGLDEWLATSGQSTSLVAASTTATMAPWLYQTPYGLAKRRQLTHYAASGIRGTAFLLPSLNETANASEKAGPRWSYSETARKLAAAITWQTTTYARVNEPFRLVVPDQPTRQVAINTRESLFRTAKGLLATHLYLMLGHWDSPHQHRKASHHRLAVTPPSLREHVDHHTAPPRLLRRLKRSLGGSVEIVPA